MIDTAAPSAPPPSRCDEGAARVIACATTAPPSPPTSPGGPASSGSVTDSCRAPGAPEHHRASTASTFADRSAHLHRRLGLQISPAKQLFWRRPRRRRGWVRPGRPQGRRPDRSGTPRELRRGGRAGSTRSSSTCSAARRPPADRCGRACDARLGGCRAAYAAAADRGARFIPGAAADKVGSTDTAARRERSRLRCANAAPSSASISRR